LLRRVVAIPTRAANCPAAGWSRNSKRPGTAALPRREFRLPAVRGQGVDCRPRGRL